MVNTIKFSEFVDGGDLSPDNTIVGLEGTNARFTTFPLLPPGTTGNRPIVDPSMYYRLRFNTTLASYEYYSPLFGWVQLEDSVDVQDFPFIIYTAEPLLPNSFNLATLTSGLLKQTVFGGIATPAIGVNDVDYYGPGMMGYLQQPAGVKDINGNIILQFSSIPSAVNYIELQNNATAEDPTIFASGTDTDINMAFQAKGLGAFLFSSAATLGQQVFLTGSSFQHATVFNYPTTAIGRQVNWQDADGTVAFLSDITTDVQSVTGTANQIDVDNTDPQNPILSLSSTLIAPGTIAVGNLLLSGNTLSSTDTDGDLNLIPNGLGDLTLDGLNWPQSDGSAGYLLTTNGSGQLGWVAPVVSGIAWNNITGTSQAMLVNNGYIANNAGLVTLTLPATAVVGTTLLIQGNGAGGWQIAQNSGQNIQIGNVSSTIGASGSVSSSNRYDSVQLVCTVTDTTWCCLGGPQSAGLTIV